jgi:hypothetical protein
MFFADWLKFVGITDSMHVRFAPSVVTDDADSARRGAEAELSALVAPFAGQFPVIDASCGRLRAEPARLPDQPPP